MKKKIISLISLLLSALMLMGIFASCVGNTPEEPEENESSSTDCPSEDESSNPDKGNDEESDKNNGYLPDNDVSVVPGGDYSSLIHAADNLKNGVTSYFADPKREYYTIENRNTTIDYVLTKDEAQLLTVSDRKGNVYIENTMDVFVKMTAGGTYYSSGSSRNAVSNLYRYGYYYYDVHFYDQDFINNTEITDSKKISLGLFKEMTDMEGIEIKDGVLYSTIKTPYDPQIRAPLVKLSAEKYNALRITMKTTTTSNVSLFIVAGEHKGFNEEQRVDFSTIPDGEYHTYIVVLDDGIIEDYTGDITQLRMDFNGSAGEIIEISELTALKVSNCGAPNIRMDRNIHTYTDKIHQTIRLFALTEVTGIEEVGMITKIKADTVAKLIVKDKNKTYDSLEGVDWASAEYIGFDIKNAGVFGYIMPVHEASGKMTVTLEGDYYVITQTTTPENGTLKAPIPAYTNQDQVVKDFVGTSIDPYHSESEFDFGHRLYTDETHDFAAFIHEAECERNPLSSDNIVINEERSPGSTYDGYDPLRGIYCFTVKENIGFHDGFYYQQNKHCPVSFKITGDNKDRNVYVLAYTFATSIECAAILDKNDMMLPVPLEVSKNFSNEFEEPIYAWGDIRYSEVRFPMVIKSGESQELTVLHLYQNWGHMPLKQLSSIQFFSPYYHLSTGCSESNCIASYYVYDKDLQTLPDHRAMSAPLWDTDPQHTNGGFHYWLQYTDSEGNYYASEDKINTIYCAGPTYAEIDLTYVSDDGKIKVTYNHLEMPQTDENRTYYQMSYEVLEDVSFNDFSRDFSFYSVHGYGNYSHIGYLDENNDSQIVDTGREGQETMYKLGDKCPYFDMFEIENQHNSDNYANVAFIICNSEFVMGGKKVDPGFVIIDKKYTVRLSLDLGSITLKKGDKFTINAILLPWGSQETDYTSKAPDRNVRDIRRNSAMSTIRVNALNGAEVMESEFLPRIKSGNGNDAEFTLIAGAGNISFRVYGFNKLTAPVLYEKIEGNWVPVDVTSQTTPDKYGNAHAYDGYAVHYDGDGTYSYSFVVNMDESPSRTFKVDASQDFTGWPEFTPVIPSTDVFYSNSALVTGANTSSTEVITDEGMQFVRIFGNGSSAETCITLPITAPSTGDLLVIKYRIPTSNKVSHGLFQAYTSTVSANPSDPNYALIYTAKQDDEWHVMVVDLSAFNIPEFIPNEDGTYSTKHLRFDIFNTGSDNPMGPDDYIDLQYIAICKNMEEVAKMNEDIAYVDLVEGPMMSNSVPVAGLGGVNDSDYFNLYFSADFLYNAPHKSGFGNVELAKDGSYIRFYASADAAEGCVNELYTNGNKVTGKYFVLKYRLPTSNPEDPVNSFVEVFTSTTNESITGVGDFANTMGDNALIKDGEWHVLVLDVTSKSTMTTFTPDADGKYTAKFIRLDVFNGQQMSAESYMDIAFFAVCEDPSAYLEAIGGGNDDGGNEDEGTDNPEAEYFNLFISAENLSMGGKAGNFGKVELADDKSYVSFYGKEGAGESYFMAYTNGNKVTGQYFVVKYRIPTTNPENPDDGYFEFFTSTVDSGPVGPGDNSNFASSIDDASLIKDGEWHVFVLDVTTKDKTCKTYTVNEDGKYVAKFIRFDVINQAMSATSYIDIAFLAVCEDPSEYLATLEENQ